MKSLCPFLALALLPMLSFADNDVKRVALESLQVPDGFTVESAITPGLCSYPMFMAFDPEGRMYVAESSGVDRKTREQVAEPDFMILRLEDTDDDGVYDARTVFADKLPLPMGVLWHQGSLFVASPPEFVRFDDHDGDGVSDHKEVLIEGWNVLNTASLHGPFLGPDGWLYLTHGRHGYDLVTKEGEQLEGVASRIWRCRPDGTQLERMAGGGLDNPVEIIFTDAGETLGTMTYFTDPMNGQRDGLMHWVYGGVYPKPHPAVDEFVLTGELMPTMTKFARIAPSGLERYRNPAWGDKYQDDLFSAQFNPHRVQRHQLFHDGATYRTRDSDFLTSTDDDFHPTDVLEDADGSLLISDTGAWYVDACPISRVSRPNVIGGIYRIRKDGAQAPADPWGRALEMEDRSPAELTPLLADERPKVRDRALELLVASGADAVPAAVGALKREQLHARLGAVWALGRIGTADARAAVREALGDKAPEVRIAAARMAGLEEDGDAGAKLAELLADADPGVRRQAATALSQLGEAAHAPALLAAAAEAVDRFEEHALIFGVIKAAAADAAREALDGGDAKVRRAALIALDQMPGEHLEQEDIVPFLTASDALSRDTGLWVAAHHPAWSEVVVATVEEQLRAETLTEAEAQQVREILLAYAEDETAQALVAELLGTPELDVARKEYLLKIVAESPVSPLPERWNTALGTLLQRGDPALQWAAVSVVSKRNIDAHDALLTEMARDASLPSALRVSLLEALAPRMETLAAVDFAFLVQRMQEAEDVTNRVSAARVLAGAPLAEAQRLRLAKEHLAGSEAMVFAALLDAFRGKTEETVGLALVDAIKAGSLNASQIAGGVDQLLAGYPAPVQEAAAPLRAEQAKEEEVRIARLEELEPRLGQGDVGRGRRVFFGDAAACHTCHAVGDEGGRLGPDLTTIGTVRSGHDLLEAVLFPNASFVPEFTPVRIDTTWETYAGIVLEESPEAITLAAGVNNETRIPREDIVSMKPHSISIMPEGLDMALSEQDLLDLIAFMQSLNDQPWLLPEQREE